MNGSRFARWPVSKHSCSGRMPSSTIAVRKVLIVSKLFSKTVLNTKSPRRRGVLRVVHRAHVQGGRVRLQLAQVLDPLLDRNPDRPGRVVDHHVVHLGEDGLGDGAEVLHLVARRALRRAGVDMDHRRALIDGAAGLGGVLLGGVRDGRALVAVGDYAAYGVGDDRPDRSKAHCRRSSWVPSAWRLVPRAVGPHRAPWDERWERLHLGDVCGRGDFRDLEVVRAVRRAR